MPSKVFERLVVEFRGTFDKLQTDMNSAAKTVSQFERRFSTIGRGIGAAFGAGIGFGAVATLKKLTTSALGLAELGDQLSDLKDSFIALGGNSRAIDAASQSVQGLVSNFDLLQAANTGLLKGIPGLLENFPLITEAATKVAEATGQDAAQAVKDLTNAIASGKPQALAAFGVYIEKGAAVSEIYKQLAQVSKGLGPLNLGVADTVNTVANAWDNAKRQVGIYIDKNPELIKALEDLREVINTTDFQAIAEGLAAIATFSVKVAGSVGKFISDTAKGLDYYSRAHEKVVKLTEQGMHPTEAWKVALREIAIEEIAAADAKEKHAETQKKTIPRINETTQAYTKQRDEIQKLREEFDDFRTRELENEIREGLKGSIESLNETDFKKYSELLRIVTEKTVDEKIAPYVANNFFGSPEVAENYRDMLIDNVIEPVNQEWENANKEAFQNSVDFWTEIFENAITGVTFDLEDALKRVAVGFAAQIMASLTGISFQGGAQGIGAAIAAQLGFGQSSGGMVGGLFQQLGMGAGGAGILGSFGMTAGAAQAAGIAGPAMANGMFAGGTGILGALGPWGMAAAVGGGLFASAGGFDAIGGMFGGGKTHPETQARRDVMKFLEDKLGRNIVSGPDNRFNGGKGFEALDQLDDKSKAAFTGVGTALNALLGITEDTGGQIGAILASNFQNVDGLRGMIHQLGVGFEEFEQKLIETGIQSNRTWLEIESDIASVENAFKPGLEAVGDYNKAIENLVNSGGRGFEAIQSLRDAAIEANEAGMKSMEEFKQKLIADGKFTAEQINIIFQALNQRGVTSLDSLANASDRTAGAVVADMTALGFSFKELADAIKQATDEIKELASASDDVDAPEVDTGSEDVATNALGNVFRSGRIMKFARGGIVSRPTLFNMGLMGEAGPEAIMPLARKNGVLGVRAIGGGGAGQVLIQIDARGAAPGVEHQIERAIRSMRKELVEESMAAMNRHQQMTRG